MTKRALISGLFTAIGILCLSGIIAAQEITGSIVGSVSDSNGAAVPNATVTVTLPSQGDRVVRTVTTTSAGNFSIPNLPVAVYRVRVEAPNFKKVVNNDVKVDVGQRRQLDVTLSAGQIDEVVTVDAENVVIESTTPTAGTTISGNQVRELSINNRNFVQLVTLAPGVSSNLSDQVYVGTTNPDGQANIVQISVNGARSSQNTFTVDGADITDRGSNLTIQAYPSVDAIGEFKVLRSLYPAESGRSGGGQVNVVTRSGTDQFHGSLFEFVRNEKFNASSYLNNRTHPLGRDSEGKAIRPPFRYNNYGFTIGGPIYFLRFGNAKPGDSVFSKMPRTYFFFSEEQRKDRRFPTLSSTVPTAGMKSGVFAYPICLSGTISGSTRTCTQILPAGTPFSTMAAINPVSAAYLTSIINSIPSPNNGTYGLLSPASGVFDFRQEIVKVDTAFTNNWTAYYRYQRDKIPTIDPNSLFNGGSGIPGVSTSRTDSPGRAHTLATTWVVNPNFILDARYTYSYGAILGKTIGTLAKENSPSISIPMPFPNNDERVAHITGAGISNLQAFGAYDNFSDKHEMSGSATWIVSNHTMKFGVAYSRYRKVENALGGSNQGVFSSFSNTTAASPTRGTVCVNGAGAGITCSGNQAIEQAFANFLLGTNAGFTQSKFDLKADFRQQNWEAYAQDEFKIRRNVTLYFGVRYSFFGSPWDKNGHLSNFVPELWDPAQAPLVTGAGNRVAGTGNYCNGIIVNAQNYQTGPASYNCSPISSPWGKYIVNAPKRNFAPRFGIAWDPFGDGKNVIRTGYGIYHEQTLVGTFEQLLGANPPYQETITVSGVDISNPVPGSAAVVASASPPGLIRGIQTDYKTPYMQHWSLDYQRQIDKSTVFSIGYYGSIGTNLIGILDINNLKPGYAYSQMCATGASTTPTVPCQGTDGVTGLPIPFTSSGSELILDQIRPFRGWRGIGIIAPRFSSNYHSLQVSGTRRLGRNSQASVAYTWSKNLTNSQTDRSSAPMDTYNIDAEYGRAALDRRHILTGSYVYELPFFDKRHDFTGVMLGGWQFSGIVTYQTGLPYTATFSSYDPAGIGFLNPSSPAGGRPYLFGNPNSGAPHTFDQWFNTSVFQDTRPTGAPAVPGNSGRGVINGPRTFRIDFTLVKNFNFTETMRLQLRGEMFNALNTTNFTTFGTAASTTSSFGRITGVRDPRTMQFGIKFLF